MTALGTRLRTIPSWHITLGIALLALGFLVAAQVSSERPRVRYTTQERPPLVETVLELQRQQETLKDRILALRSEIQATSEAGRGSAALVRELNDDLAEARLAAGLVDLVGPGLVLQLEDSSATPPPDGSEADLRVNARDIRTLAEELWLAGADAIAVNGERLTATSAIVDIGGSVLVNQAYLAPPYQLSAIGPPDLYERLSASQGYADWVVTRVQTDGIGASWGEFERVEVPAFAGILRLDYARVEPSPAVP